MIRVIAVLSCLSLTLTACDADEVLKLLDARVVEQDLPATTSADLASAMERIENGDPASRRMGGEPDATPPSTTPEAEAAEDPTPEAEGAQDATPEAEAAEGQTPQAETPDADPPEDAPRYDARPSDSAVSSVERQILDLLNDTRLQAGRHALTRRAGMSEGARDWSCEMARTGEFRHADLRAVGVSGENIAWGQRSAEEVHEDWMNSSGHRDNRMNARWTEYGIGVCTNGSGQLHYTERFR